MQDEKVVITLDGQQVQELERIALDDDQQMALVFVKNVIKPAVDAVRGKGHCKPIFEWHRGENIKTEPPPIKE
jgi:hypothetical protein